MYRKGTPHACWRTYTFLTCAMHATESANWKPDKDQDSYRITDALKTLAQDERVDSLKSQSG